MRASVFFALVLGPAALTAGCTGCSPTDSSRGEQEQLEFSLRTGAGCAMGCALDRALLVGTEERVEILADAQLPALRADSADPEVAAAWVEPSRLCCADGRCAPLPPTASCTDRELRMDALVLRALGPGSAPVTIREAATGRVLDTITLQVERAASLTAREVPTRLDEVARTLAPAGEPASLRVRIGRDLVIELEATDGKGRPLHATAGLGASVVDATVATLAPPDAAAGLGEAASLEGDRFVIRPRDTGRTTLRLTAGDATRDVQLLVAPPCDPITPAVSWGDVPCQSDADCVPAQCCHATTCAHVSDAPDCDDVACTADCRADTLDCGGRCLCLQGRCATYLWQIDDPSCTAGGALLPAPVDPTLPPWRPEEQPSLR